MLTLTYGDSVALSRPLPLYPNSAIRGSMPVGIEVSKNIEEPIQNNYFSHQTSNLAIVLLWYCLLSVAIVRARLLGPSPTLV